MNKKKEAKKKFNNYLIFKNIKNNKIINLYTIKILFIKLIILNSIKIKII